MSVPPVNIPAKVRFAIYVAVLLAPPIAAYLYGKGWIGETELVLVGSLVTIGGTLAAANTPLNEETP